MVTVSIEEAQARLPDLIEQLPPGEAILITKGDQPLATLTAQSLPSAKPRQPGSARGVLTIVEENEEHLADFQDYMPASSESRPLWSATPQR